jgi:hypothetical protein
LSLLLSLPPFVPALFLLFLSTSSLSSLHFFPFLHFSSFHLVNFVSLLASFFFCVLPFFRLYFRSRRLPPSFIMLSLCPYWCLYCCLLLTITCFILTNMD